MSISGSDVRLAFVFEIPFPSGYSSTIGFSSGYRHQLGSTRLQDIDLTGELDPSSARFRSTQQSTPFYPFTVSTTAHTLTFNSHRSIGQGRPLGASSAEGLGTGARTYAGSLLFIDQGEDPFLAAFSNILSSDDQDRDAYSKPDFVDQLPPFHIILSISSEVGFRIDHGEPIAETDPRSHLPRFGVILGCKLSNFGIGYSIDDAQSELTYSYVASGFYPVMRDPINSGYRDLFRLSEQLGRPVYDSGTRLSSLM